MRLSPEAIKKDNELPFFAPGVGLELATSPSPLALNPPQCESLYDIVHGLEEAQVRNGTSLIGTIVASSSYRGKFNCKFEGVETTFIALLVSGSVRIYKSTDLTTWTEITAGSGIYGNTRMTDVAQRVQFTVAKDKQANIIPLTNSKQDALIIQNGTDAARVYSSTESAVGAATAKVAQVAPPTSAPAVKAVLFQNALDVWNDASTSYDSKDTDLDFGDTGTPTATNNRPTMTIDTTVDYDDWAVMSSSGTASLLNGKMLYIGVETSFPLFLESFKIQVGTYSGVGTFSSVATIWDPNSPTQVASEALDLTNKRLYGFDVQQFNSSTGYPALKFIWVGSTAPLAATTVEIFCVAGGVGLDYATPGLTDFAMDLVNSGSHTSSPGFFPRTEYKKSLDSSGSANLYVPDEYRNLPMPISQQFYYGFVMPYKNPAQAVIDLGVDVLRIYRKKQSDDRFKMLYARQIAAYFSAWGYTSGTDGSIVTPDYIYAPETSQYDIPIHDVQPADSFHRSMPISRCVLFANSRMFCGSSSATKPDVYISEQDQPFRFSDYINFDQFGQIDAKSPGVFSLFGDIARKIIPVSGAVVGASSIFVLGEQSVYATSGLSTGQILQFSNLGVPGTVSPETAVTSRDALFYLDREMQVRRIDGGSIRAISLGKVDDQTKGIPGAHREGAEAVYFGDQYLLAYTPAGATTNTRVLVWDDLLGRWASIHRPPTPAQGIFTWYSTANKELRLYYAGISGSDIKLYRFLHPDDNDDLGTNPTLSITGNEMYFDGYHAFQVEEFTVMADPISDGSIAITRDYKPNATQSASEILMSDPDRAYLFRRDGEQDMASMGDGYGSTAKVTLAMQAPSGTKIYLAKMRISAREDSSIVDAL